MGVIDAEGLFRGKRLRKCSAQARLFWPYLFLMSNGYARLELDYDVIADEFASFRDAAPTPAQLEDFFAEYQEHHLLLAYSFNGHRWAQWCTRRSWLKDFKTADDRRSPAPPEPEYTQWLQEQHGSEWADFHWDKVIVAPPSPDTPPTLGEDLAKSRESVGQDFALGVGVGLGVGNGKGEEQNQNPTATAVCAGPALVEINRGTTTARTRKPQQTSKQDVPLPDWITSNPAIVEAWADFIEMRKRIRAPLTGKAITLNIAELEKLRTTGNDPIAVLNQSVARGWKGLFPLGGSTGKPSGKFKQIDITTIQHTAGHEKRADGSLVF